jgi:hypothetical protein
MKKFRNEKICPVPMHDEDKNGLRFFGSLREAKKGNKHPQSMPLLLRKPAN